MVNPELLQALMNQRTAMQAMPGAGQPVAQPLMQAMQHRAKAEPQQMAPIAPKPMAPMPIGRS